MTEIVNITELRPRLARKVPESPRCDHLSVEVDEPRRHVGCQKCGATLDPFAVLVGIVRYGDGLDAKKVAAERAVAKQAEVTVERRLRGHQRGQHKKWLYSDCPECLSLYHRPCPTCGGEARFCGWSGDQGLLWCCPKDGSFPMPLAVVGG